MRVERIHESVRRGLGWLWRSGQAQERFHGVLSRDPELGRSQQDTGSVFPLAVVLRSVCSLARSVDSPLDLGGHREDLVQAMDRSAVWAYWPGAVEPDADVTAVCLEAVSGTLSLRDKAACVARLMAVRDRSGRFLTWMDTPADCNVLDAVVNANVVCSLGDGSALGPVAEYLRWSLGAGYGAERWPFYVNERSFLYSMSRAVERHPLLLAPEKGVLRRRIAGLGQPANALGCAEQLAASIRCGGLPRETLVNLADQLLRAQSAAGGWPAYAYYVGPKVPIPPSVWFGGAAMTTALAVEALGLLAVEFDD